MESCPVKVSIHVTTFEGKRALVTVTYQNVSERDIWILRDAPNLFVFCEGKEVQDIGPSDKRAAYTMDDHERVAPHATIRRQVEISDQFDFFPGTHRYDIQTGGGYIDPVSDQYWEAPPAKTQFNLTR